MSRGAAESAPTALGSGPGTPPACQSSVSLTTRKEASRFQAASVVLRASTISATGQHRSVDDLVAGWVLPLEPIV